MPEKGWSVLTVRESTALKVKGLLAKAKGITVDAVISEFLTGKTGPRLSPAGQWSVCEMCGSKVKTKNLEEHMAKVHQAS